tara:strand:+ start:14410 stop:14667 length:258 start_codon:yes stop_codon:yes gene_type:complete
MQTTSTLAREAFESSGKKQLHHDIILKTLELCPYPLTAYGISKRCSLSYVQTDRRLCELRRSGQIEFVKRIQDLDGSTRNAYKLV